MQDLSEQALAQLAAKLRTVDEGSLDAISRLLKSERDARAMSLAATLRVGIKVYFDTRKYGRVHGTIERIGTKNATVRRRADESARVPMLWTVHVSYLHKDV